jgi:phosphatidylserine/phosphatidylglycerophosphate/cardiolipin synthase-like enzyme
VQLRLDSNPRYLHHDVIVIDGEVVITGSLNFSRAALTRNDENVVIVPDPALAKKFDAEFSRLWATAAPPEAAACADRF